MIRKLGVTALVAGLVLAAPGAAELGGGMRLGGMGGGPSMEVLKQ